MDILLLTQILFFFFYYLYFFYVPNNNINKINKLLIGFLILQFSVSFKCQSLVILGK